MDGVLLRGDPPKQSQEGRLAVLGVAQPMGLHLARMPVLKRVMAIIQIGSGPGDAERLEPGNSKLGLKTLAEASLGLRVDLDAAGDGHRNVS